MDKGYRMGRGQVGKDLVVCGELDPHPKGK